MIVVRYVFQCQFGKAGETANQMVAMFKKTEEQMRSSLGYKGHMRILTDLSGPFDTVVQEMEFPSLADWEAFRAAMFSSDTFQEGMGDVNPFVGGHAELYTLEAAF